MTLHIDGFAIVTGAAGGIGKACAFAYAAEGAAGVAFADLREEAAQEAAEASKSVATNPEYRAIAIAVDVLDEKSVQAMVASAVAAFGRLDYAVNSAGIGAEQPKEVSEVSVEEFDRFYSINVRGTLLVVREVSRQMKTQEPKTVTLPTGPRGAGRGCIINLGSSNSFVATPHIVQYTTSKHAVVGLTRNSGLDLVSHNIRVNCVCPAWVRTPMVEKAMEGNPALADVVGRVIPMQRLAEPEEVADVAMFLSSPRASFVTSTAWLVDGGATFCPTLQ